MQMSFRTTDSPRRRGDRPDRTASRLPSGPEVSLKLDTGACWTLSRDERCFLCGVRARISR